MKNLILSTLLAVLAFALTAAFLPAIAGVLPAVGVFTASFYVIARRVNRELEVAMPALMPLLQERKIDEAKALLDTLSAKWGPWQPMLAGQLTAQKGMLDYMQLKWDEALPQLEAGKWRNWQILVSIGLVHHRRNRTAQADQTLTEATLLAGKEPMVYLVRAVLKHRAKQDDAALQILAEGLKKVPGSDLLNKAQQSLANGKGLDVSTFPEAWFQFFPEDMLHLQLTRARSGAGPVQNSAYPQQPPPANRKMRRR